MNVNVDQTDFPRTNLPQHQALIHFPECNGYPPELDLKPAVLVEDPELPLHKQRALGVALFGGEVLFEPSAPLSDRETQVAALTMTGLWNKACAEVLWVSPSTAGTHVENVSGKIPRLPSSGSARSGYIHRMTDVSQGTKSKKPMMRIIKPPAIEVANILTERQMEVARLVARGLGSKAAGVALEISPLTVTDHVKGAVRRMGIACPGVGGRTLLGEVVLMSDAFPALVPVPELIDPFVASTDTDPRGWHLRRVS